MHTTFDKAANFATGPQPHSISPRDVDMAVARLEVLARVMDKAIMLPGTNVAIGVDAILGLLPVIGDAISATIGSYLIWEAKQLGAPRLLLMRMAGNVAVDTTLGAIPLVGDIFDVTYRSNMKNIELLKKHVAKHGLGASKTIDADYTRLD